MTTPRQETGGPNRTPRSEIQPAVAANRKKEPAFAIDFSTSMDWSAQDENNKSEEYPSPMSRRAIVMQALPLLVARLESEDSEAAGEQAGGSDDLGGVYTVGFASSSFELGDLNSSNIERKLQTAKWGGGTHVVDAIQMLIEDYQEEFGDRTGDEQPVHEIMILTDGQADDWQALEPYLLNAGQRREDSSGITYWPTYVVAIVGHGDTSLKVYNEYRQVADQNKAKDRLGRGHVTVVNFDSVTNPTELAEDLITLVG